MADRGVESFAYIRTTLDGLKGKGWAELGALPPYTDLPCPEALTGFSFCLWKDERPDGSLRIVVQGYRYQFLGFGRMSAEGFVIRDDGTVEPVPQEEMWQYL